MPTPPRLPRTPSSSALWSLREQRGAPPLLRSAQVQFAEGRGGEVAPTAASARALSTNRFEPLSTRQALGTPPYPPHTPPLGARNPLPTLLLCRPL